MNDVEDVKVSRIFWNQSDFFVQWKYQHEAEISKYDLLLSSASVPALILFS